MSEPLTPRYRMRIYKGSRLLLETTHTTRASLDIELSVVRDRIRKGEVSHAEWIDHNEPFEGKTLVRYDN